MADVGERVSPAVPGRGSPDPCNTRPAVAIRAVLCVLAHRLPPGPAQDPGHLEEYVRRCDAHRDEPVAGLDQGEFVERVADHLGIGEAEAEQIVHAVFRAIAEELPAPAAEAIRSHIPRELEHLWRP